MGATNGAFFTEQFLKPDGTPYAGVRVFHYVAGNTTTNLDVYQDGALNAPHNQPVDGDAAGRVSFYGSGTYRLLVKSSTADGNLTLYDWDPVELMHHTATVRAEDKALSLPSAYAAARGRIFGVTDAGGDVLSMWFQRSAAEWEEFITPVLTQMLQFAKGDTIASSADVTIPDNGNFFDVTGTNTIETMSGFVAYPIIYLRTISALTFQHHATNLTMQGSQDRLTFPNQITAFFHVGAGQWTELWYQNPFFGNGSFIDGSVLVGNVQGQIVDVPLPSAGRALGHIGTAGLDPSWVTGFQYHGPTAMAGVLGHSGNVTYSTNQSLFGLNCYTNFTLNAGVTLTLPATSRRLVIVASDSITVNGAISALGAGGSAGQVGTDQPGGNGGGDAGSPGGNAVVNGCVVMTPGGRLTAQNLSLAMHPALAMGGAGGGNGLDNAFGVVGAGGAGGGSIVLIAPRVTLGGSSFLNTSARAGVLSADASTGGGGGGGGNVYIVTRTYVNNGATVQQTGGAAGVGGAFPAGVGQTGVMEVLVYG